MPVPLDWNSIDYLIIKHLSLTHRFAFFKACGNTKPDKIVEFGELFWAAVKFVDCGFFFLRVVKPNLIRTYIYIYIYTVQFWISRTAPIFVWLQTLGVSRAPFRSVECLQRTAYIWQAPDECTWIFRGSRTHAPLFHTPQSTKIGHFATYTVKGKLHRVRLRLSVKFQKWFFY